MSKELKKHTEIYRETILNRSIKIIRPFILNSGNYEIDELRRSLFKINLDSELKNKLMCKIEEIMSNNNKQKYDPIIERKLQKS